MRNSRLSYLTKFYQLLGQLEQKVGGKRILSDSYRSSDWPKRGVYFFFEEGELRTQTGNGNRIVRVGTHALKKNAKSTLWGRLKQHKGKINSQGGNHRGSVFRKHLGKSLIIKNPNLNFPEWGKRNNATRQIKDHEQPLEAMVSEIIGDMPFLWLDIDDEPGPDSLRGYIERNSIALLSNFNKPTIDPPSKEWIGNHSAAEKVRLSGIWNVNHVDEGYDLEFLDVFNSLIDNTQEHE